VSSRTYYIHVVFQEAIQMSQVLEESMRMYEEENRKAPPDESLAVSTAFLFCVLCMCSIRSQVGWLLVFGTFQEVMQNMMLTSA